MFGFLYYIFYIFLYYMYMGHFAHIVFIPKSSGKKKICIFSVSVFSLIKCEIHNV